MVFLFQAHSKMKPLMRIVFCVSVETSLKTEIEIMSIVLVSVSSSLKNEIVFPLAV